MKSFWWNSYTQLYECHSGALLSYEVTFKEKMNWIIDKLSHWGMLKYHLDTNYGNPDIWHRNGHTTARHNDTIHQQCSVCPFHCLNNTAYSARLRRTYYLDIWIYYFYSLIYWFFFWIQMLFFSEFTLIRSLQSFNIEQKINSYKQ